MPLSSLLTARTTSSARSRRRRSFFIVLLCCCLVYPLLQLVSLFRFDGNKDELVGLASSSESKSRNSILTVLEEWHVQQRPALAQRKVNTKPALTTTTTTSTTATTVAHNNTNMSACLLVMDDTIKLTEWLAYHYTVLPLTHLIVAIDPQSVLQPSIQHILNTLWKPHLTFLEIWTQDMWMTLNASSGWPPGAYNENKTLLLKRMKRIPPSWIHKRRQEHFCIQCMRKLKRIHPSWVLNMDTDEFLLYNYFGPNETDTFVLDKDNSTMYRKMTRRERNRTTPIRASLPLLNETTIGHFLADTLKPKQKCLKIPGLPMSAREQASLAHVLLSRDDDNVAFGRNSSSNGSMNVVDARTLMTLRHLYHGRKEGHFTKTLLDLQRIPMRAIRQDMVRTIHSPLAQVCGKHANAYIGYDYPSSVLRLHHYAGTMESFDERQHDARRGRNESFAKRNVEPVGETSDIRPWIGAFVRKVGVQEAQRLLQPLKDAYRDTNWSAVWADHDEVMRQISK